MLPFVNKKTYGLSSIQHVQLMFEAKEAIRKHLSYAMVGLFVVLLGAIIFKFFHLIVGTFISVFGLIFFIWHFSKASTFKSWLQRLIFESLKEFKGSEMFLVPFSNVDKNAAKDFLSGLEDNERKMNEIGLNQEKIMNLLKEAFERGEHKTPKNWDDFLKNREQKINKIEPRLNVNDGVIISNSLTDNENSQLNKSTIQLLKEKENVDSNEEEYLKRHMINFQEIRFFADEDDAKKHGIEFKNPFGKLGDLVLYKNIEDKEQIFEYDGIVPEEEHFRSMLNESKVKDFKVIGNIVYKKVK